MIGIFDSGIGGLTVVRALTEQLPGYDMIYFGDTAHTPYGSKSPETVITYALRNTDFLLSKSAKLIVMACNTASSVATDRVTEKFDVPVFEVITPAAELSLRTSKKTGSALSEPAPQSAAESMKKNQSPESRGKGLVSPVSPSCSVGGRRLA